MDIVEAIDVRKKYVQGEVVVEAVRGIDLVVRKGELLSIIGRSGSGKSTLLTMLGAIETPTSGQILLEGTDYAKLGDDERTLLRRRRIGFIFQAFNLIPTLTALENVALPLELDGVNEDESRSRAAEILEQVDLGDRIDHLPSAMSGGQQQRVAVARALVIRPALVLADEPTGNLDSVASSQVMTLLRDLVDKQHQTVVMVTHDLDIAAMADRVIHMRDGHVVNDEAPNGQTWLTAAGQHH
ncbi:MAG: ABC transporter ATP-binding protein [Pirellulales bacterium]